MQRVSIPLVALFAATLLAAALAAVPVASAQAEEEGEGEEAPHALREDAWALQFGVGESFTLRSFEGSTISFKRHTAEGRAWQFGLTLDGSYQSRDSETRDERNETRSNARLSVTARYLVYPRLGKRPLESVQLFGGAGPVVSYGRFGSENAEVGTERTTTRFGVGASAVVGAEWFVKERISLSASYASNLVYRRESREENREEGNREDNLTSNSITLNAGGARLGLSVYF